MRYYFSLLLLLLVTAGCSFSDADMAVAPPQVYTENRTYLFTVQKEGEACTEEIRLTREEAILARIPAEEKVAVAGRDSESLAAAWQIKECAADSLFVTEAKITDNGQTYSLSYPQTQLLHFASALPALQFHFNMPLNETKVNTRYQLGKSTNVGAQKAVTESTYRGITSLALADTTYTDVHQVETLSDSRLGKISHTYYFHQSLGVIYSDIRLPDGSHYKITLQQKGQ